MRKASIAVICAVTVVVFGTEPAKTAPVEIRVDWTTTPAQLAPLIPSLPHYAPDVYRHYGKSYVVDPLKLEGGGATLTALAVGDTDLSTLGPQALVLGVTNAKLDLRVIGLQVATEMPGYLQTYFWVRRGEVESIDDLKGKIIGISALGSTVSAAAAMVMANHGFRVTRDYRFLELPFPSQLPALEAHEIDAAVLVPPFHLRALNNPALKPVFGIGDAFGPVETSMWVATSEFVARNRAILVDFLEDNIRMRRWMFDPMTRADAVKQLSDTTKIPVAQYADWVYTKGDYYYDPDAKIDVAVLQKNINDMKGSGLIPQAINVAPYVDLSLAVEATRRIRD
jgi:ABC-type nitrate/sulfonate/bicarbonate transport system substrate-binding protein